MNPLLVIMAVRAAIRLARAGEQAFGQYARDREVMLPLLETVKFPQVDVVRGFFEINPELLGEALRPAWESFIRKPGVPRIAGDFDVIAAEYARVQALQDAGVRPLADEFTGLWMVKQWGRGREPPGPFARVVLTIVDVAAEFAAHDPRLFGVGGNAELLVQSLAAHISELVPDTLDTLGPRNLLGERLAGVFLKAALSALSEHPDAVIEQQHVQRLVQSTLPSLIAAFPATLAEQVQWRAVMDALLGPVATQAVKTIAEDPSAFFGRQFGTEGLLGPLTRTYLLKAAELGLDRAFSRAALAGLYQATLTFAAAHPQLFAGAAATRSGEFLSSVLQDLATVAKDHSPPFDADLLAQLAAATLEIAAREGSAMLDPAKPWDRVVSATLTPVVAAIVKALRAGNSAALRQLTHHAHTEAFVRIIITEVARTPGLIGAAQGREVQQLVGAIVSCMAVDEQRLLSYQDWMAIAAAVAAEVAANPGRLVGSQDAAAAPLLAVLLGDLIQVAGAQWQQQARAGGTVLFGNTLREAIISLVRASASHAAAALQNALTLRRLAAQLTAVVATRAGKYGSKQWLSVYRALLVQVLSTGVLADPLDEATIDAALTAAAGV